jgi:hypothetical protein
MLYRLSYAHHVAAMSSGGPAPVLPLADIQLSGPARPAGVEPAARGLEGRCSIQLSYGRMLMISKG